LTGIPTFVYDSAAYLRAIFPFSKQKSSKSVLEVCVMLVNLWRIYAFSLFLLFWLRAEAWQAAPSVSIDASGRTTVSTYDARGNLVSLTDGTGKTSRPGAPPAEAANLSGLGSRQAQPRALSPITIQVPADQPTIQAAINAANNGDTVMVSDGTYHENINFNGKAITVTSVNGASVTTIDGSKTATVVLFVTNETSSSALNGFTITNGFAGNQAPNFGEGGGIAVEGSSPTITNNVITANGACNGAGIGIGFAGPLIQGNTISNNFQSGCSGGIGGGGVSIRGQSDSTRLQNNVITNNTMTDSGINGGGLSLFAAGAPLLQNNIISNNTLLGIAMVNAGTPHMIQNLITDNTGGGLATSSGGTGMVLLNNTFANNDAMPTFIANFGAGSALAGSFPSDTVFQNNLIIAKQGQVAVFCTGALPAGFVANDIFSNGAAAFDSSCTNPPTGNGADPMFVDPAVGNYHVLPNSPVIAAGNTTPPIPLPTTDLDGNPRIRPAFLGLVDEGVFEFQGDTNTNYSTFSLTFPPQKVGTTSSEQDVGIANLGPVALQVAPFNITGDVGDYTITDNCHNSHGVLLGSGGCGIAVTFSPKAQGGTAQITIISNDAAGTKTITLSGAGLFPVVNLSTTSLTFSNQLVGTTSSSQPVTLSNTGDADLTITGIVASGDFGQTNNCGTTVAASSSCTINVTFSPTLRGTRNGALTISDDAAGNPHVVSLQGNGIGPAATLSPNLTFTGQLVGTTSSPQSVSLSSTGETALTINHIAAGGDFAQTNNCPASLPNGQNCTIQVTFTPTARGTRSATLTVTDNSLTSLSKPA
jgi:parallel beta-helix repeat protein/YD repeat-containing protein